MNGNFDAIKRRATLRKDVTSSRQDKVQSRKNNLSSEGNGIETFPVVDTSTQMRVKKEIQKTFRAKRQKERLLHLCIFIFSALILSLLAWKFDFLAHF